MSENIKPDITIDLKGLLCPMPVIRITKQIKEIEIGQIAEVITTDPGSLSDFPAWARKNGNDILETIQNNNTIKFYIKRNK